MMKFLILLALLMACGKKKQTNSTPQMQVTDADGIFYGRIYPMNNSNLGGHVRINKMGDSLVAKVKLTNAGVGSHEQYLHENNGCPVYDPNSDGKIDVTEVNSLSGARIIEFIEGIQESSYSVMLAAVGKENLDFDKRTVIIYREVLPIGCAELDLVSQEPSEPEVEPQSPRTSTSTYTRPRADPDPDYEPPSPPPEEPSSWWDRLSDRLRRWWCRIRNRCS